MPVEWHIIACPSCGGHGQVSRYSHNDFEGAEECSDCGGSGRLFVSPKDRLAEYPGGPFQGQWPGAYAKGQPFAGYEKL